MARTVGIGIQNFGKIIENNCFYVDKTSFIKEWWESKDDVTLITRPRRFGKTLNMSMLEYFFSSGYAGRTDLFEGLSVWKEEKYQKLQGTYPVISLSFANIKETDFETANYRIRQILMILYEKNAFLRNCGKLSDSEKSYFERMASAMSEKDAPLSIYRLSDFLYRFYGKKVIILLDEYDTPMQEAYVNGYWEDMVSFARSLFSSTFKANPYLERAVLTSITRVGKESVFSDLNNLKVVTSTSCEYATAFGFTEEEMFAGLEECGLSGEKERVKWWYDGFIFGTHTGIYNPWSAINFLDTGKYNTYWANTSTNSLVNKLIRESGRKVKASFERLLQGESIQCPIDEQIVYNQLDDNESAIYSLLLASGYLKVLRFERMELLETTDEPLYELALTNHEVERMFYSMVRSWFAKAGADYNDFVKAMLCGNVKEMNAYMNRIALQTFSCFDTGLKPSAQEPESFYHGFVLGLIADLGSEYIITSNRESGFGRYDVMLEPKNPQKNAVILEFKVHDPEEESTLKDTVQAALCQINEKQYEAALSARGIASDHIYKYGFAFAGKRILIGKDKEKPERISCNSSFPITFI